MRWTPRLNIISRLSILMATTLLLVMMGEAFNSYSLRQERHDEVALESQQLAHIAALDMDHVLESAHQLLATLGRVAGSAGGLSTACDLLEQTANSDFEYDSIAVVDLSGSTVCGSSKRVRSGTLVTDFDLFERALASGEFEVGSFGIGIGSGNEVIRVAHPIRDHSDAITGVIYAGINVTWLNTAIGKWNLSQGASILITDRNGILVANHPESAQVGKPAVSELRPLVYALAAGATIREVAGTKYIFGFNPVNAPPAKGLAVFVGRSYEEVFAAIDRSIYMDGAVTIGTFAVIMAALWAFIQHFLNKPFKTLLHAVEGWRAGDWSMRIGAATGITEFDRLTSAFDQMAENVSRRDADLLYRDRLLRSIADSAAELVREDTFQNAIPDILRMMGTALQAERILIIERGDGVARKLFRVWHVSEQIVQLTAKPFERFATSMPAEMLEWLAPLDRGELIHVTRSQVRGAAAELFDNIGIKSNLQAPIMIDGRAWGALSVDDCSRERTWTSTELDAIKVLADLIGTAISREGQLRKLADADQVVRGSPAILFRVDVVDGRPVPTYLSDNVARLGYSAAELLDSARFFGLVHPDDMPNTNATLLSPDRALTSGSFEFRLISRSGVFKWFENRYTREFDEAGRVAGISGLLVDVDERKIADQKRHDAEETLSSVASSAHDAILMMDVEGKVSFWNAAAERIFGYSRAEALGQDLHELVVPLPARADFRQHFPQFLETGRGPIVGRTIEVQALRKGGGEFPAEISLASVRLRGQWHAVAIVRDITERRNADVAIRRERDFSNAIIEQLPGIFFVLDGQGRNVRFNAGILQALGKTAAELVGTSALDNVIAADRPMVAAKIREAIEIGRTEAEIGLRHGDGSEHHYVMTASRTKLSEGAGIMGIGIDVTEARRIERLLHESEERFRAIFASVTDAILLRDFETLRVVEANESACAMFASSRDALIGTRATDLSADIAGDLEQEVERRFADARRGAVSNFEWLSKARDGRIFPTEVSLRRITLGGRPFFLATLHDISERKRAEAKIVQMARFDGLTGLANRVVFTEALEKAIGYVRRGGQGFAVLYLDLDHFKDINDTLGHPMGDALLKEVAARLRGAVRDIDTVARFGGDEFAVLETNIADPTDAGLLAGRLLELLAEPYTIHGNTISSSASIGIAISGAEPVDAESLLSGADVALYRAKSEERGTYRFFTSAMDAEVRHRVETSNDLRGALASGQIFLEYQPQVDATNGQIVGLEALARWRHPQRGLVPPLEFIPIAERNGLINALGLWILRESCRQMRAWRDAGLTPPAIAVNLSAVQFKASQNLEAEIGQAIQDYGLRPGELELELTESVLMDAARNHNDVLVRLRSRGVRLAIDDFGTGYSSLDYLRRFPVDRIKIAQEFITDLDSKAENGIIVRAAIGLSRELGISILAEGVETRAQLDLLDQWGCRNIQGFYFSRPVPAMQAELLLRRGRIDPLERAVA